MVFSLTWDAAFEAQPADTDQLSEGALRIRDLKKAIRERMEEGTIDWDVDGLTDAVIADRSFPTGTKVLFQQTAAPTGWTKDVVHDDKALRIVSGTASSGGTTAFSAIAAASVDGYVLLEADLPSHVHNSGTLQVGTGQGSHSHPFDMRNSDGAADANEPDRGDTGNSIFVGASTKAQTLPALNVNAGATASVGSDTSHAHVLGLDMQFVDIIIATKDAPT